MIAKYNRLSFVFGVPGLIVQGMGFTSFEGPHGDEDKALLFKFLGGLLLVIGLGLYSRAKGRTGLWGLLGIFSIIGLIVLAALPDRAKSGAIQRPRGWAAASAKRVGAPAIAPTQALAVADGVQVAVGKQVTIDRGGRTVAAFPRHAATFVAKLANAEQFTAEQATAWEPTYHRDDVASVLGTLVKLGVLVTA